MTGNTIIGMGQSRPLNEKAIDSLNDVTPGVPQAVSPTGFTDDQLRLMRADAGLSGSALDDVYNPEGDGEHPVIPRAMWRMAVEQQETISGYWDWVAHRIAAETVPGYLPEPMESHATRRYLRDVASRVMGDND